LKKSPPILTVDSKGHIGDYIPQVPVVITALLYDLPVDFHLHAFEQAKIKIARECGIRSASGSCDTARREHRERPSIYEAIIREIDRDQIPSLSYDVIDRL
jgi:hypothetical protein